MAFYLWGMDDRKGVTLSQVHSQTQKGHKTLNEKGLQRRRQVGVDGERLGGLGCRNRELWGYVNYRPQHN